jgi:uncharacterized repeat protein (TIGR01451 family)
MMFRGTSLPFSLAARRAAKLGACALFAFSFDGTARAAGTPAGSVLQNTATATYAAPGGGDTTITSNTVSLTVDEVLGVTVVSGDPGDVPVTPGSTGQILRYTLTNVGNGNEKFSLLARANAGGDDFDPTSAEIILDTNGNGAYDAGVDTLYVAGTNDPDLAPDGSRTIFIRSAIPAGVTDGQRARGDLVATALTGSGAPGTVFIGQGQGGGNAIVGTTGGTAEDDGYYRVQQASIAFVKSAAVLDPFGQTSPMPGAFITYTLSVTITGSGSIADLRLADAIPAGTTYRAGTLTLDGGPLTDAADADAGNFTGSGIAVSLGNVPAGAQHNVTFQVRID